MSPKRHQYLQGIGRGHTKNNYMVRQVKIAECTGSDTDQAIGTKKSSKSQ